MTASEKEHIVKALQFELSQVETKQVRQRMMGHLAQINEVLSAQVGTAIGETVAGVSTVNPKGAGDVPDQSALLAAATTPTTASGGLLTTAGLSMEEGQPMLAKGRKVAILIAAGVSVAEVEFMKAVLLGNSASCEVVGPHIGPMMGKGGMIVATKTYANSSSVVFDAIYVPGGDASVATLEQLPDAKRFIDEAYKHGKAIAASSEGVDFVAGCQLGDLIPDSGAAAEGVILEKSGGENLASAFVSAVAAHRFHNRQTDKVIA